jgi:hypothetical protein
MELKGNKKMAYVYRHIRHDKNQPFYIGIGSDSEGKYTRAFVPHRANNRYWNNIVAKTSYSVDILIDEITWEEAIKKEIEFIAFYKRKEHGGILANLTDGGEGALGLVTTDAAKRKQSLRKVGKSPSNKGKKMPQAQVEAMSKRMKGKRAWNKGISPKKESVEKRKTTMLSVGYKKGQSHPQYGKPMPEDLKEKLRKINTGRPPWNKGIPMTAEHRLNSSLSKKGKPSWNKGKKLTPEQTQKMRLSKEKERKPVIQFTLSKMFVAEYTCTGDAAEKTGFNKTCIKAACAKRFNVNYNKERANRYRKFIWEYKSPPKDEGLASSLITPTLTIGGGY